MEGSVEGGVGLKKEIKEIVLLVKQMEELNESKAIISKSEGVTEWEECQISS